ncbi:MAG: NAD-dependent DNA ligase LigA [Melioribacteraceae bacterium]|nr:NAD-dependent DNA ligase LigA [Melioribacteraceae bacterium]MCF8263953.1 NAD-dependent DNA ligase LigA [Melioribacteraceae bacterium]MCF8431323.1 NAD-dependent DNA ligase LigA [Melioribacteraceae bacterium]
MMANVKDNIESLRSKIRKHEYQYYVLGEPLIADFEFDQLYKSLEKLEQENPNLITPDSPTQRIGSDLTKEFRTIRHKVSMLSLSNTYNEDELIAFDNRIKENVDSPEEVSYVVELKIDGVSASLIYEDGKLKTAVTRGDGVSGEEITNNVKTIKSVPLSISENKWKAIDLYQFEVRGEIFMEIDAFQEYNSEREKRGEKTFANPRNSTAGTIKMQDPKIVAERPLDIFTYYLIADSRNIQTHSESLELLAELGFKVNKNYKLCNNINEVVDYCNFWENERVKLPYETDGVVIKVNSLDQQSELGTIAKSPRWAVAYKFKPKQATTRIKDIRWQVGRTGAVTPVADLEPVLLAGSTISHATLHNMDEIRRKDIRLNDKVIIEKGGDVIPKIVKVIDEERNEFSQKLQPPKVCPVCSSKLFQPDGEVAIYCQNPNCRAQIKGNLEHFSSRGAMDIEGMGKAIIDQFVELELLKNIADIYNLKTKRDELISIERLGEKSVDNLLNAIEESKNKSFEKVLFALGIRYIGAGVAQKLSDSFKNIDEIINADEEKVTSIHDIGQSVFYSLRQYFSIDQNLDLIKKLKLAGLNFESSKVEKSGSKLDGLKFVITGTLPTLSREEAKSLIESNGGSVVTTVSKNTNLLLAGEKAGSKLSKAEKLGINIIDESGLFKMIQND